MKNRFLIFVMLGFSFIWSASSFAADQDGFANSGSRRGEVYVPFDSLCMQIPKTRNSNLQELSQRFPEVSARIEEVLTPILSEPLSSTSRINIHVTEADFMRRVYSENLYLGQTEGGRVQAYQILCELVPQLRFVRQYEIQWDVPIDEFRRFERDLTMFRGGTGYR